MSDQKTTKPTLLILVDGSSYIYRAFHALPALTNSKGFPTGAVYGMVNMLKRLMADYQPEYMAVVFDAKGKTFRDDLYAEYKANRQQMPDDLSLQIETIHRIIEAMGLPIIMLEGVEADDVIGTIVKQATLQQIKTLVSTSDKDLAQLVSEYVTLVNTMSNTLLDPNNVREKFGVPPEHMIDYLALIGDTTDNIPGVPMVGPKTAAKWLQQYGSLDDIIANANQITGKVGENLRAFLHQLPLTKSLVTIKCDVDYPLNLLELQLKAANKQALISFYQELEFKTWLAELLAESKDINADKYAGYDIINDSERLHKCLAEIKKQGFFAFDTHTTTNDYMTAQMVGISVATSPGKAVYIPFGHNYLGVPAQLNKEFVLNAFKSFFEDKKITKICQQIKYDCEVLSKENIEINGPIFDTMMESYILDSASTNHDLDTLALKYLGWRTTLYEEIAGKGTKQLPFNEVDLQKSGIYAAESADVTLRLHELLWPKIQNEKKLKHVFADIELPLIFVLARIEKNGVLIDPDMLRLQGKELEKRLHELEEEAFKLAGQPFNMNSPKQLQEILFLKLKLPILQKTPTGQASTADNVLQELALEFDLPRLIIEYRSLSKLISTYTSKLVEQINPTSKRIHTTYNQAGTTTGRLSSSEPNLQNIPIRMPEGRRIRKAFIAPKGYKIVSADYSQIELRLMAHLSGDPGLLNAFASGLDIHRATAAEVWNVPIENVSNEIRRSAKAINFGLIYGMSAFGLTKQLGIDRKSAQEYIDRYFARYPKVKAYMDNARKQAKEKGFVETLWGRRLYIPDINASQMQRQKAAERAAINAPLQGSAADIIKLAMIKIDAWLSTENINAKMIMQVHDELVFEAAEKDLAIIIESIKQHMASVVELKVPLVVSAGIGDNWDEASNH